jgi:hypothetical protein
VTVAGGTMVGVAAGLTAKFRYNAALAIAGFVALCGTVPLAAAGWYLLFVMLVPLAVVVWGLRAGVDVRDGELRVRWGIGGRRVDAAAIAGFTITHRAVRAVLVGGRTVWLPSVPGTRVPVLAEAVGLHLATDPATDPAAPEADSTAEADSTDSDSDADEPAGETERAR